MVLREGDCFGKSNVCKRCGKRFKYVVVKTRQEGAQTTQVCKPCYPQKYDSLKLSFEGYMFK